MLAEEEKEQIAMLALWNSIRKYKTDKGAKFTTYFINQIRYEYLNYLNRYKCTEISASNQGYEDAEFIHNYETVEVEDLISTLSPKFRRVIRMKYFENCTLKEIGKRLHCSTEGARLIVKAGLEEMQSNAERIHIK